MVADSVRLTVGELAALVGDPVERIEELARRGVLHPDGDGRFEPGDAHRIRIVDGFEEAGVPLDALVGAQEAGLVSVAYYDDLHAPPGHPSGRTYATFKRALGARSAMLPAMYGAFGIAEPESGSHLSVEDEALLVDLAALVESTGQVDLALRIIRQFGEATRRASVAALEVYGEVIERMGPGVAGVPARDVYERHFLPWARLARVVPTLSGWLSSQHISRAIDDYSIGATEQVLETAGYVAIRADAEPAVAFLDLTGFTRLTQQHGDVIAADVALRLGDLAGRIATMRGGRVIKLLGDGVLTWFPNVISAVEASLELLEQLPAADLPTGHVGVSQGPIIGRDGDVFGRTVNLAARISDVTPSGELYVPALTGDALADRYLVEPVGASILAGIGPVELARVARAEGTGAPGGPFSG